MDGMQQAPSPGDDPQDSPVPLTRRLRLIVMRHAKAGELPGGPDAERALTERGRRDSACAGRWLQAGGFVPEAVICSAARRTRQTWQQLSAELAGQPSFSSEAELYQADADDLLDIVARTPDEVGSLMYIGHNPAAAQFACDLTGAELHFPTSAIAVIGLPAPWSGLAVGRGELIAHWTPKGGAR